MTTPKVTEADREAARMLLGADAHCRCGCAMVEHQVDGRCPSTYSPDFGCGCDGFTEDQAILDVALAFARHREAEREACCKAACEYCAGREGYDPKPFRPDVAEKGRGSWVHAHTDSRFGWQVCHSWAIRKDPDVVPATIQGHERMASPNPEEQ